MGLRFSRLRRPEWLVGVGGALLLASMLLLPWYSRTLSSGPPGPRYFVPVSLDGWHGLTGGRWLILVTVLAAFAVLLLQARHRAPALPVAFTLCTALLGGVTLAYLIVRVWVLPPGGREIGGWIGLLGAAVIAYAANASIRLEGIAPADAPAEIPTVRLGGQGAT